MKAKKIWEKILSPDEKIEYEFSLGKRYINFARFCWIILGIPLLFLFGVGIIFILFGLFWGWYLRRSNNYALTNKRILILKGWLSTHLISIEYDMITDIRVFQPFFEKMIFNTGKIVINTAGTDRPEIILTKIENPYQVKQKLYTLSEKDEIYEKV